MINRPSFSLSLSLYYRSLLFAVLVLHDEWIVVGLKKKFFSIIFSWKMRKMKYSIFFYPLRRNPIWPWVHKFAFESGPSNFSWSEIGYWSSEHNGLSSYRLFPVVHSQKSLLLFDKRSSSASGSEKSSLFVALSLSLSLSLSIYLSLLTRHYSSFSLSLSLSPPFLSFSLLTSAHFFHF